MLKNINRRSLGRTGREVSEVGLGTWPLGGTGARFNYGAVTEEQALKVLEAYVDGGGNFLDTARTYNNSERMIGKYLKQSGNRERLVISSKTHAGADAESVAEIDENLEGTLRTLGTDYVDVYFLHTPPEAPEVIEQALEKMLALKKAGKIRSIGASIKGPNVTAATEALCDTYMATGKVDVIQVVCNILRQRNMEVIERAGQNGVGVIVRTVLESGLLTGSYAPDHVFTDNDHRARYNPKKLAYALRTVQELREIAVRAPYRTLTQVAIRFVLAAPGVSCIILGAQSPDEVRENLTALALPPLAREVVDELRARYGRMTEKVNFD
jgi:aryl-alcohol dehydrogenase-like predicted oxidoreductase